VATELPDHITHAATRQGAQQLYDKAEVTAEDVRSRPASGAVGRRS
jgi:hypothetical protein